MILLGISEDAIGFALDTRPAYRHWVEIGGELYTRDCNDGTIWPTCEIDADCDACNGEGEVLARTPCYHSTVDAANRCGRCGGSDVVMDVCSVCLGSGREPFVPDGEWLADECAAAMRMPDCGISPSTDEIRSRLAQLRAARIAP